MIDAALDQELHELLEQLSPEQRQEVVDFARFLVFRSSQAPQEKHLDVPSVESLKFAGTLSNEDAADIQQPEYTRGRGVDLMPLAGSISQEDLKLMSQAIEKAFGHVEPAGWE